uniref:Uncharacterized protein n=1 Tax=Rhizophora mucronata TaxID=61149 RepID=A0A2P2IQB7_RHIMU
MIVNLMAAWTILRWWGESCPPNECKFVLLIDCWERQRHQMIFDLSWRPVLVIYINCNHP